MLCSSAMENNYMVIICNNVNSEYWKNGGWKCGCAGRKKNAVFSKDIPISASHP